MLKINIARQKFYNERWRTLDYSSKEYMLTADLEMAKITKNISEKKYFFYKSDFRCFNYYLIFCNIL